MSAEIPIEVVDAPWDGKAPTLLITTRMETRMFMHTCYHAQTLEAYSETHRCTVWIPLPCKQWKCRWCAERKIHDLARRTEKAKPNRLLTLTVDTKLWDSPRAAFDGTRRKVSELSRRVRTWRDEFEYLRVTELTRGGWPHYHLLVRSPYLPHPKIRDIWKDLTGAAIVDLRQVKGNLDSFYYLVKYLSKMHEIGWTERHVSYTKRFFPEKAKNVESNLGLVETKVIEAHPAELLYVQYRHAELVELCYGVFTLQRPEGAEAFVTEVPWSGHEEEEEKPCSEPDTKPSSEGWSQGNLLP